MGEADDGAGVSGDAAPRCAWVAISGASGLIGSAVAASLVARGVRVTRLVRRPPESADESEWSVARGLESPAALAGVDAVIHLAGEAIADRRWSAARKRRLRDSRVPATEALARSLATLERPPATLITASAIGIYGDRGDEPLTEDSATGTGFLAELARDWEAAAAPARARGIRTVALRTGLVLSPRGGLLGRLLPPFRLGIGGTVGRPRAWWSWITLDDVVGLTQHILDTPDLSGPCNAVAPEPVTGAEFARALGRSLGRPAWFPVPPFALRLAFGEMADEAILASIRVAPHLALRSGYAFRHPRLDRALRHVLGRDAGPGRDAAAGS